MATLGILGAQRSCLSLIWPHGCLLSVGRPASLSVYPPDAPRGGQAFGRGENGGVSEQKTCSFPAELVLEIF